MRKKIGVWILTIMMMTTMIPQTAFVSAAETGAAGSGTSTDTREADPSTMDNWETYFGTDDNFSTKYAGHVWTDKTVLKGAGELSYAQNSSSTKNKTITLNSNDENNFLVALSAMASTEYITGQASKPTDTMIVLDLSSSMYRSSARVPDSVNLMIESVNETIKKLQDMNVNNRVGVTIYYGGPDLNQAKSPCSKVLLPLDRYEHSEDKYLKTGVSNSKLQSVKVNNGVKNSKKQSVSVSYQCPDIAGTYTQQGILSALEQFMNADDTVPESATVNPGASRVPVMILMSDGKPTATTYEYTKGNVDATMGSNREDIRNEAESDFLTQLTAAYAREMMDIHYEKETPLFYTLSLGETSVAGSVPKVSYDVMDPCNTLGKYTPSETISGYWDTLIKNGAVTLKYKNAPDGWTADKDKLKSGTCTVSKTTVKDKGDTGAGTAFPSRISQMDYVDQAFEANGASQLADAFTQIYEQISIKTHYYPTLVEGDDNLDGYVSFVDKIGKYMNVTDVKGIVLGDSWYSGAEFALAMDNGEFGSAVSPTPLGDNFVWAVQQRLGIDDAQTARNLIRNAHQTKQLSYDKNTGEYSNYIGWYANSDGKYLGFWDEAGATKLPEGAAYKIKSYGYLGEVDEEHGVMPSDMMYTVVQVRTDIETGEQSVAFGVPAALVPVVEYHAELNQQGKLTALDKRGATKPIRLVYEVALNDEVTEKTIYDESVVNQEYVTANKDTDGCVSFYTNQYEVSGETGWGKLNTYAYFNPSYENDDYYYQEDTLIYTDTKGTKYESSSAPDVNGTYYRAQKIYEHKDSDSKEKTIYRQFSADVLGKAQKNEVGNTWYIPKNTVRMNKSDYTVEKSDNKTNTLKYADVSHAFYHEEQAQTELVIGDTLGNNGRVKLKPVSGIKLTKSLAQGANSEGNPEFSFVIKPASETVKLSGSYDAILVDKDGNDRNQTVTFDNGKATVTLKAGESIYITGLPNGSYNIKEEDSAGYVVSSIEVNKKTISEDKATVNVSGDTLSDVEFTNADRGKGNLTITKTVAHELGDGYVIPEEANLFEINVALKGVAIEDNQIYTIKRSSAGSTVTPATEQVTVKDGKITFNIKDKEQVEICDLPEGTKATVTESEKTGFTASYKIGSKTEASSNCVVEIVKNNTESVQVINTYKPKPAEIKIDLSGIKKFTDDEGKELEDWDGAEFHFVIQKHVFEDNKWQWVDTENVDTATQEDKTIDFAQDGKTLTFNKAGTYAYQVIERNHGQTIDGIKHDATMHTFSVIVTDKDMDGQLEATVQSTPGEGSQAENKFVFDEDSKTWVNNQIDFTNVKTDGETSQQIMIKKALNNPSGSTVVSLSGYQFELYQCDDKYNPTGGVLQTSGETDAAGETYISLSYKYSDVKDELKNSTDKSVTYYYQLKEKSTGIAGMTDSQKVYNFAVKVSAVDGDADSGKITSAVTTSREGWGEYTSGSSQDPSISAKYPLATFTNTYSPAAAKVKLDVNKTLEGRDLKKGEFKFVLEAKNGDPLPTLTTATNDENGEVDFGEISFNKIGTYNYTVEEEDVAEGTGVTKDSTVYNVQITVKDDKTEDGAFTGKLKAEVTVLNVASNTITFKNSYKPASTDATIDGTKELTGLKLTDSAFSFTLTETDEDGSPIAQGKTLNAYNNADGTFAFKKIEYDEAGVHYYMISEDVPSQKRGVVYDETKYMVKVTVEDDLEGKLVATKEISKWSKPDSDTSDGTAADTSVKVIKFVNNYVPAGVSVEIPGRKSLDGKTLTKDQFSFTLYESDEAWTEGKAVETVSNNEDGSFEFSKLKFECDTAKLKAGEKYTQDYYYIIKEGNAGETIDGVTYDSKSVGVKVTVSDTRTLGYLEAQVSYYDLKKSADSDAADAAEPVAAVMFNNVYEITGETSVNLSGTKYLEGRELKADEFTFVLTDESGDIVQTAQNDAKGNFAFELKYDAEDVGNTYKYTVKEAAGALDGVKYDSKEYAVTVDVKDNGTGGVAAEVKVKKGLFTTDDITFKNIYENPKGGETKTGDSSNMLPFAVVAAAALAGIITLLIRRKKA